jgi:hypothetical protein
VVDFLVNTGEVNQSEACQVMTRDGWIRTWLEKVTKESGFEQAKTEEEAT